jgi:hypothetical protein
MEAGGGSSVVEKLTTYDRGRMNLTNPTSYLGLHKSILISNATF